MKSIRRYRRGFTLLELTIACAMTVSLAALLFATWAVLMRSTANLIAWEQLFQEMDLAVTAIGRDAGGGLLDDRTGTKRSGCLLGCRASTDIDGDHLQFCFDGSGTPNGQPNWALTEDNNDVIIDYYVDGTTNTLVRKNLKTNTQFTVARNVGGTKADGSELRGMTVDDTDPNNLKITLNFLYVLNPGATINPKLDRSLIRPCTLIVKKSP